MNTKSQNDVGPSAPATGSPSLTLIRQYLELGGLFNPELMEHYKVRDMVILARDEIVRLREALMIIQHGDYDNAHDCKSASRIAAGALANTKDEPR